MNGERILVALDAIDGDQGETRPRVTVVLNWFDEVEKRTAGGGRR